MIKIAQQKVGQCFEGKMQTKTVFEREQGEACTGSTFAQYEEGACNPGLTADRSRHILVLSVNRALAYKLEKKHNFIELLLFNLASTQQPGHCAGELKVEQHFDW